MHIHVFTPFQYKRRGPGEPITQTEAYHAVKKVLNDILKTPDVAFHLSDVGIGRDGNTFYISNSWIASKVFVGLSGKNVASDFPFVVIPIDDLPDPARLNMDPGLWDAVQTKLQQEPEFLALQTTDQAIAFLADKVHAVNAFNGPAASVFITVIVRLLQLDVSKGVVKRMLKTPNPTVKVAGAVLLRYAAAPEEFMSAIRGSGVLHGPSQEVVTVLGHTQESVGSICRKLILSDEVLEAWLPTYPKPILVKLEQQLKDEENEPSTKRGRADGAASVLSEGFEDTAMLFRYLNGVSEGTQYAPKEDGTYESKPGEVNIFDKKTFKDRDDESKPKRYKIHGESKSEPTPPPAAPAPKKRVIPTPYL